MCHIVCKYINVLKIKYGIFLLILIPSISFSQIITNFSVKDGLSSDNVYDLHFDNFGRLWMATENGLNLFNGGNISEIPQYGQHCFLKFFEGDKTTYCVSMGNGLYSIYGDQVQHYQARSSKFKKIFNDVKVTSLLGWGDTMILSNGAIYSLINNKISEILINGHYVNLENYISEVNTVNIFYRPNKKGFVEIYNNRSVSNIGFGLRAVNIPFDNNSIWHLAYCFNNNKHFFVQDKAIYSSDDKLWNCNFIGNDDQIIAIRKVKELFYLGTAKGRLYEYNSITFLSKLLTSSLGKITAIGSAVAQELWVATEGKGLYHLDLRYENTFPLINKDVSKL